MFKKILTLICLFPICIFAQTIFPGELFYRNPIQNHTKASNSLKLFSIQSKIHQNIFPFSDWYSVWGSYKGNRNQLEFDIESICEQINFRQRTFTATIHKTKLAELLNHPQVLFVDIASKFNSPKPLDEKALLKSNVFEAQKLSNPYFKGKDVVVGIVDIGFQTNHPTFFDEYGKNYRVRRFWQQQFKNQMGPAPFYYGILKSSEEEILNATDNDGSHGTHVAGIAGGSGFKSSSLNITGVAPESDLVFVGIKYQNDSINGSALGDYIVANNTILDGFDYIFRYADSMNKPAVCNLSWGMHTGPHDGTSLFDLALEDLINEKNPNTGISNGRALVGANGNSANDEMHVYFNIKDNVYSTLAMDRSRTSYSNENVYCDFWANSDTNLQFQVQLIDSNDQAIISTDYFDFRKDSAFELNLNFKTDSLYCLISSVKSYPHNQKGNVLMMLESNRQNRFIKINFKGTGEIHGWNSGRTYEWTSGTFRNYIRQYKPSNWVNGDNEFTMSENGGTSKAILSVGSYNNRVNWNDYTGKFQSDSAIPEGKISRFSSQGPALDGRIKPDISAPGQYIANAFHKNQVPGWLTPYVVHKDTFNNEDVYWALLSGTSMASPHAAGVVALVLEATKGDLNAYQIYDLIRTSSYHDEFSGNAENNIYGYGKIDAYRSVLKAIQLNRNNFPDSPKLYFYQSNGILKVNSEHNLQISKLEIYSTIGQLLFSENRNEKLEWDITALKTGIYLINTLVEGRRHSQMIWVEQP